MTFEYGSAEHENLIFSLLALANERMPPNHFEPIEKIHGNDNDKVIWFLSNKWMHVAEDDEESKNELHELQSKLIINSAGPLANYLTDQEWNQWVAFINEQLANLRTFNGSFLGLLWSRKILTDSATEKLNIIAWYYVLYYVVGAAAYNIIRPKIIDNKGSPAFIDSNRSMTIMQMNLMDAARRFNINNDDSELVKKGLKLIENFQRGTSWETYYDTVAK
jgi:hypothetical protein